MDQEFALLFYILLYCLNPLQQAKMSLVIKQRNEGEEGEKKGRVKGGSRKGKEGREGGREEAGVINPCTNSICKDPGRSRATGSN